MIRCLVLDIETALDRDAVAQVGRTGPGVFPRSWLHRIVAASTLSYEVAEAHSAYARFELATILAMEAAEEPGLLDWVDQRLATLAPSGRLISFNGLAHDLPALQRRRLRHWRVGATPLGALAASATRHRDLLRLLGQTSGGRWPSLRDICAALRIPCAPPPHGRRSCTVDPVQVKCEIDVVATFILACFLEAQERQTLSPLARGWTALADFVLAELPARAYLAPFATTDAALLARQHVTYDLR